MYASLWVFFFFKKEVIKPFKKYIKAQRKGIYLKIRIFLNV